MCGTFKMAMFAGASTLIFNAATQVASAAEHPKREGFNETFVLSHLKHMHVVIGKLDAAATARGESEEHLRHLVTEGLAPTHITMTAGDDCCGSDDKSGGKSNDKSGDKNKGKSAGCGPTNEPLAYLKVRVIPDGADSKGAAYSVSFALVEKAKIARNSKDLMVSVWTKENVGRLGDDGKGTLDKEVEGVLKDFHRDYLMANSSDSAHDVPDEFSEKAPHNKRKHK